jgi:tripartite ATP-independent transporter DctM subunit
MYSIFLGAVVYKELNVNNFITTIIETGKTASKLMLIVSMAGVFGWILAYEGIPAKLATLLFSISDDRNIILLLAVLLILFLGCFMEGISILLIVVPILLPVLKNAGIDLVHFGVVQSIANNIGLITPPLGIAGYIVADIAKVSFEKVVSVLVPFIIILIVALFIIAYFPRISLWLPTILMGYGT